MLNLRYTAISVLIISTTTHKQYLKRLVSIVLSTVHYRNICIIKNSSKPTDNYYQPRGFSQLYEVVQPSVSSLFG